MNTLLDRVAIDPEICGGKPCIEGTRLWVSLLLDFLADGMTEAELLSEYPQLTHHDVMAAIAYGAEMSRERILPVPLIERPVEIPTERGPEMQKMSIENKSIFVLGDLTIDWRVDENLKDTFDALEEPRYSRPIKVTIGGSGINFARHASKVGFEPFLLGVVGRDTEGAELRKAAAALKNSSEGFDFRFIENQSLPTGKAIVVFDAVKKRLLIDNSPNANRELTVEHVLNEHERIRGCRAVYVSGYCITDREAPRLWAVSKVLEIARHEGIPIILDLAPHNLYEIYATLDELRKAIPGVSILISEVATVRRMLGISNPLVSTLAIALETAREMANRFQTLVLRYGHHHEDGELIWHHGEATSGPIESNLDKPVVGLGDRLTASALLRILK